MCSNVLTLSLAPLRSVGISVGQLVVEGASLAHWTEAHLHRLVAHFLQVGGRKQGRGRATWTLLQVGADEKGGAKGNRNHRGAKDRKRGQGGMGVEHYWVQCVSRCCTVNV